MARNKKLDTRLEITSVEASSSESVVIPNGTQTTTRSFAAPSNGWLAGETPQQGDIPANDGVIKNSTPVRQFPVEVQEAESTKAEEPDRNEKIGRKPVLYRNAKSVLSMTSDFEHKFLCTGPVLNLGDACVFSCVYCYVEAIAKKFISNTLGDRSHQDAVVRRAEALKVLKSQLRTNKAKKVFHVVYSSSLVDIAATMELLRETAAACVVILEETLWDIRLLTKSNLLPQLVKLIPEKYKHRLILGVSTGTFDDEIGKVIERGTALVSKRIESLHLLQDAGFRTFAMVCPSLPQDDYDAFARKAAELLRYDRCEHVWAEAMNIRGESFVRTIAALDDAGLINERDLLAKVCGPDRGDAWEEYSRATFEAHKKCVSADKLRFLQYVNRDKNLPYWKEQEPYGAVILGTANKRATKKGEPATAPVVVEVEGTAKIRELLESVRATELKLKRKVMTALAQWVTPVVEIGAYFNALKNALPHGKYINWIVSNFPIDRKTANNYVAIYLQRDVVLDAVKRGTVPHLTAAYELARKASGMLKAPKVKELAVGVAVEGEKLLSNPDATAETDAEQAAEDLIAENQSPVLVLSASEAVLAELLELLKQREENYQYQVIRQDGEIRLNEYFAGRLGLAA